MSIITPVNTRHEIARSIYRDVVNGNDIFYVFAGKTIQWNGTDNATTPVDTQEFLSDVRKNMLYVKQVDQGPVDIVYVIRRIDWEAGTAYEEYRDDVVMSNKDFYVMTDNFNIYKCLDNNSSLLTYTIDSTDVDVVDISANTITYASHGFTTGDRVVYTTAGGTAIGGLENGKTYFVISSLSTPNILKLALSEDDASSNNAIAFTSLGVGSTHTISKKIAGISVRKPTHTDNTIARVSDGYIWKFMYQVPVLDRLKFLTTNYIPVRNVSDGVTFNVNGLVDYIDITDSGSGYTLPVITFQGDGIGAEATAEVDLGTGAITNIIITNSGAGYSYCTITITDPTGIDFSGVVHLEPETSVLINQNVVNASTAGAIYRVEIIDGGSGYSNTPTISSYGDGSSAIFSPTIVAGSISDVTPTVSGSEYNYIRFEVVGLSTRSALLRADVGPLGGHGSNIPAELFATSLCINTVIENNMTDLFVDNDFRQLGIVKNITAYDSVQYYDQITGSPNFKIEVSSTVYNLLNYDDEVETYESIYSYNKALGKVGKYKVVTKEYIGSQYFVYLSFIEGSRILDPTTMVIDNLTTLEVELAFIASTTPEFEKQSGSIIFVNNLSPITRNTSQIESVKLFLHF